MTLVSLDLLDQKHYDFLDKFFKDNPWADNAHMELIIKQTGLNESIIKSYIEQRRMNIYSSNNYNSIKNDFDMTTPSR
jgi:hypothetical protein